MGADTILLMIVASAICAALWLDWITHRGNPNDPD